MRPYIMAALYVAGLAAIVYPQAVAAVEAARTFDAVASVFTSSQN